MTVIPKRGGGEYCFENQGNWKRAEWSTKNGLSKAQLNSSTTNRQMCHCDLEKSHKKVFSIISKKIGYSY